MKLNYSEIIKASGAEVIKNYAAQDFFSFSTDTRTAGAGQIFIPLKGESFDGENFIQTALQKEVKGYLTSDKSKIRKKDMG